MSRVLWYSGHDILLKDTEKAEGCFVYTKDGMKYADMESGVWCTPLGHNHKAVNDAISAQMKKCFHTGYCYSDPIVEKAALKILQSANMDGKCLFTTSGSEAVEFGVQIIKKSTGKKLLTFEDSFLGSHGSAHDKSLDEWYLFDWLKCDSCDKDCASCSHFASIPFDEIGGFVFEPGSSSGLVRFPPLKLIENIVAEVRQKGGLIQVNEVTTGIGRTGLMFGFMHYGIQPDIVSAGKGIGNGYPVSTVLVTDDIAAVMEQKGISLSQSHQNDPAGASAVLAVLSEIERNDLLKQSEKKGRMFLDMLNRLKEKSDYIADVRGRGLMLSVTFDKLSDSDVYEIFLELLNNGYIVVKRPGLPVFRIDPPLITDESVLTGFCECLEQILESK